MRFYRETLSVRAVFAMARCPSVRLSVCLSVTFVHSIQTAEDIVKLLCRPESCTILVFLTPGADRPKQFQGESLQRGRKIQGGETIL